MASEPQTLGRQHGLEPIIDLFNHRAASECTNADWLVIEAERKSAYHSSGTSSRAPARTGSPPDPASRASSTMIVPSRSMSATRLGAPVWFMSRPRSWRDAFVERLEGTSRHWHQALGGVMVSFEIADTIPCRDCQAADGAVPRRDEPRRSLHRLSGVRGILASFAGKTKPDRQTILVQLFFHRSRRVARSARVRKTFHCLDAIDMALSLLALRASNLVETLNNSASLDNNPVVKLGSPAGRRILPCRNARCGFRSARRIQA